MEKFRKLIRKILSESIIIQENESINKVIAYTSNYKLVQVNDSYRIINTSKLYRRTVPYLIISKEKAEKFIHLLTSWKDKPNAKDLRAKVAGAFNTACDEMFHNKNVEMYLDDEEDY